MRFDGGILSTVKEYILDKNGEKVKLKNGNYKTRKIDTVDWNEQGKAEEWRKSWADITNKAYTKLKKNKQDTFYNEHTAEIILFESAKKYLKEHLGESKTLNISKWKSELATLKKEKNSLYNKILEMREEVEQAEKVKTCIEQLEGHEKRLSQVKRNELEL